MRMKRLTGPLLVISLAALAVPARAQEPAEADPGRLNLFFDCQGFGCFDFDFFRRQIPYVNWVRNREDSDVHVLVTSQSTGGGGQEHRLSFIGRRAYAGEDQVLVVSTSGDATGNETREAVAQRLALGLVPYLVDTPVADRLRLSAEEVEEEAAVAPQDDPWNFWVFRVGLNGFLNGQSLQNSSRINSSGSANRTTDNWKFELSGRYSRRESNIQVNDSVTETTIFEDWSTEALLVKSLTDHWSVGVRAEAGRNVFLNERFRWSAAPGIEYSVFPYSESSRRLLTFQFLTEGRYWAYEDTTIYLQTEELRPVAVLVGTLQLNQPWGSARFDLTGSPYLHDVSKYRIDLNGFINVRLFRGFRVNVGGGYSRIRDQLYISGEGLTENDILLQRRQRATNYEYFMSFGLSYQFGSIFNNVVNPRFGGSGGTIFFF